MTTLRRLLELAGLYEDLPPVVDQLSIADSKKIFAIAGKPIADITDKPALRRAWIELQRQYHEAGSTPDAQRLETINRAYQVLVRAHDELAPNNEPDDPTYLVKRSYVIWAWDGRFLTNGGNVEARPTDFDQIAYQALGRMRRGFATPQAILLQDKRQVLLLYLRGQYVKPPKDYPCHSNPQTDQSLLMWLKALR